MSPRAWRLFEWTWKLVVATGCSVGLMLWTAHHPSADDIARGLLAVLPGLVVGGIRRTQ